MAVYVVVGCGDCSALWIVEGEPETTGCPRCGTRHRCASLRRLAETEDEAAARQARAAILAERSGNEAALESLPTSTGLPADLAPAVTDQEYLAGAGIDTEEVAAAGERAARGNRPGSQSHVAVVRQALRDLDGPTATAVAEYAIERGVPEGAARSVLDGLVDAGEVIRTDDGYRLL